MYQREGEVGFMEKITCSRGGQSDTRMTDGAFVQKPNTAGSLNYLENVLKERLNISGRSAGKFREEIQFDNYCY